MKNVASDTLKKLYPIISVTVVVFLALALLGVTDVVARPAILEQRELRKVRMLTEIFPDMTEFILEDDIFRIYSDEAKIGFAFLAKGRGYGGPVHILAGLENETVKGIAIVLHTETPGLGARITEPEFTDQFVELYIGDVALRRDNGRVDAITGATISARAVVDAVRETAERILEERE